jgi:guanylate kinase
MIERGEVLENALVHGNHYATSAHWISEQRAAGHDIMLEIDWQGASQVRQLIPEAIGIFILPPSFETLLARLNKRAQDSPDVIARRLAAARDEISHAGEFNYVIINDDFDRAAQDLISIVRAQRLLASVQLARHHDRITHMKQGR